MIFLLLSSGCVKTVERADYCLTNDIISLSSKEIDLLSDETLRQIDNYNEEYKINCL